jgi:hypothetical protein
MGEALTLSARPSMARGKDFPTSAGLHDAFQIQKGRVAVGTRPFECLYDRQPDLLGWRRKRLHGNHLAREHPNSTASERDLIGGR